MFSPVEEGGQRLLYEYWTCVMVYATSRGSLIGSLSGSPPQQIRCIVVSGWWINATWRAKVIFPTNNSWSWGRDTPLALFLPRGSRCRVWVMGRLSAVAQQLAPRPHSKGTAVCIGHRWLQINKMDDTIWISIWNTPPLISFFPQWFMTVLAKDPPDDGRDINSLLVFFFFFTINNSIFLHLSVTQSCLKATCVTIPAGPAEFSSRSHSTHCKITRFNSNSVPMYWRVGPLCEWKAFEKSHSSIVAVAVAMAPAQIQFDN